MDNLLTGRSVDTGYLTFSDAAKFLGISTSTLYKKTCKREIPFNKPGGKLIRFLKSDLEAYQQRNHVPSIEETELNFFTNLKNYNNGKLK